MDLLEHRVRSVEETLDLDESQNALTCLDSLKLLSQQLDTFISKTPEVHKLVKNLNNTKVRLRLDTAVTLDDEKVALEKSVVESQLDAITTLVQRLIQIQLIMDGNPRILDLNTKILSQESQIFGNFERLKRLELKYNELLVRSITLLQNYLRLNDKMNAFYSSKLFT